MKASHTIAIFVDFVNNKSKSNICFVAKAFQGFHSKPSAAHLMPPFPPYLFGHKAAKKPKKCWLTSPPMRAQQHASLACNFWLVQGPNSKAKFKLPLSQFFWRKPWVCCPCSAATKHEKNVREGGEKKEKNQENCSWIQGISCSVFGVGLRVGVCSFFSYSPALFGCLFGWEIMGKPWKNFRFKGGVI